MKLLLDSYSFFTTDTLPTVLKIQLASLSHTCHTSLTDVSHTSLSAPAKHLPHATLHTPYMFPLSLKALTHNSHWIPHTSLVSLSPLSTKKKTERKRKGGITVPLLRYNLTAGEHKTNRGGPPSLHLR